MDKKDHIVVTTHRYYDGKKLVKRTETFYENRLIEEEYYYDSGNLKTKITKNEIIKDYYDSDRDLKSIETYENGKLKKIKKIQKLK